MREGQNDPSAVEEQGENHKVKENEFGAKKKDPVTEKRHADDFPATPQCAGRRKKVGKDVEGHLADGVSDDSGAGPSGGVQVSKNAGLHLRVESLPIPAGAPSARSGYARFYRTSRRNKEPRNEWYASLLLIF